MNQPKRLDPIHPGEILLEDFMKPLKISINQLARDLDVPPNRIGAIVNGTRSITADTALRLGTYFRVSPETWPCRSCAIRWRNLSCRSDGRRSPRRWPRRLRRESKSTFEAPVPRPVGSSNRTCEERTQRLQR